MIQLKRLPELPENPELEIRKGLLDFSSRAKAGLTSQDFSAQWAIRAEEFKASILGMKPKVFVKPETAIVIDVESENGSPQPKRRSDADHYRDAQATTPKRRPPTNPSNGVNGTNGVKAEESPQHMSPRTQQPSVATLPTRLARPNGALGIKSRTLPEIREIIQAKRPPGMPNTVPHEVYEFLCMEAVKPWTKPLSIFMNDTMKLLQGEVNKHLEIAFSGLRKRLVFRESKAHLAAFIKGHRETLTTQLMHAYKLETHRLYTVNNDFFNFNLESEKRLLARHRHYYRWAAMMNSTQQMEPLKPIEKLSDEEKLQEQNRTAKEAMKLGKDPFAQELDVAAYVRAYYLTAALRFIDNVSLHMTSGIFPDVAESVNFHLDTKLGLLNNIGKCSDLPLHHSRY
jgi:hypothetical protein